MTFEQLKLKFLDAIESEWHPPRSALLPGLGLDLGLGLSQSPSNRGTLPYRSGSVGSLATLWSLRTLALAVEL